MMSNHASLTVQVSGHSNCSAWPRERFEGTQQVEQHRYLIPLEGSFSTLQVQASEDGLPPGWGFTPYGQAQQASPDGSPWPTVAKVAKGQLGEFLDFDIEVILEHLITGEDQRRARSATHYLLIWGNWDTRPDFAHLQTCLAACRAAVRDEGIGVIDVFAKRWMPAERLARIGTAKFTVEDHVMVQIGQGFCVTAGLTEKFGREDVLMRVPDASFNNSATFLLNEVAHNVSTGKRYDDTSLFRWRQNGHMCQLVFKPVPPEECTILPSNTVLEAVDVTAVLTEDGQVQGYLNGDHADLALQEFELAAPHALRAYGWPPKPLPAVDSASAPLSILGIVPGSHDLAAVSAALGQPHSVVENSLYRWAFQHDNWNEAIFFQIQVDPTSGTVRQVSGNTFTLAGNTVTDRHQFSQFQGFLGQPELSREVILAPDHAPLRTDHLKLYANSALGQGSYALKLEIDDQGQFCLATLTAVEHAPQDLLAQMAPHYANPLLVGYREVSLPGESSKLEEELQIYLDFAEHIYGLVSQSISNQHPVWSSEQAILKTKLSGAMVFLGRNPSEQEWGSLPMSFQLMRPEFHSMEHCMELPEVKDKGEEIAQKLGVDYFSYACVHHASVCIQGEAPDVPLQEVQTYLGMMATTFVQNRDKVRARAAEVIEHGL